MLNIYIPSRLYLIYLEQGQVYLAIKHKYSIPNRRMDFFFQIKLKLLF